MDSTLASAIQAEQEKVQYDAACKRLLSEKSILAWILKDCVEEYRNVPTEEIARYIEGIPQISEVPVLPGETYTEPKIRGMGTEDASQTEGTIRYDIRFMAAVPGSIEHLELIINIEAQSNFYPGYPLLKRAIYYCSRMLSSQYGVEFSGGEYQKLKKVYSIWICMNPPVERKNTIACYSIRESNLVGAVQEDVTNYDLMTAVMICLGENKQNPAHVLRLLGVLFSTEESPETKKRVMREEFGLQMTESMQNEVSLMCNLSKGIEERGLQQGLQQGKQQGIKEGTESERIRNIQMISKSLTISYEKAMDVLGITEAEERQRYLDMLVK